MRRHSQKYIAYMKSPAWKERREATLRRARANCEHCGRSASAAGPLEIHHLTYERLGDEAPSDLVALCNSCHKVADKERARQVARRTRQIYEDERLAGWATKVYGSDWERRIGKTKARVAFAAWLARKKA